MTRRAVLITHIPIGQRGTVLIIALVFLLLMTLVGIAAMQGTTLQERMAGNHRDRNLAFQAAEAALREGEDWLDSRDNRMIADGNDRLPTPLDWDGSNSTGTLNGLDAQLAAPPVFHAGPPSRIRENLDLANPTFQCLYPVTAHGTGRDNRTVVVIQTMALYPCL